MYILLLTTFNICTSDQWAKKTFESVNSKYSLKINHYAELIDRKF